MIVALLSLLTASATCEDLFIPPSEVSGIQSVDATNYTAQNAYFANGFFIATYTVDFESQAGASFGHMTATASAPPWVTLTDDTVTVTHLPSSGATPSDDTIRVRVPGTMVSQWNAFLAAGGPAWSLSGHEIPTFVDEVRFVDATTDGGLSNWSGSIAWFDTLSSGIVAGSVLLPTPDFPHWTGVSPFTATGLTDCTAFPMLVEQVVAGGGTHGGSTGQIGLVLSADPPPWSSLYETASIRENFHAATDSGDDGPTDSMTTPSAEYEQENRSCSVGSDSYDSNGDGTTDACQFTREATRFNVELADGVHLGGYIRLSDLDGDVSLRIRAGEPVDISLSASMVIESSLTIDAAYAYEVEPDSHPIFSSPVPVPIAVIPMGAEQIVVSLDWSVDATWEGSLEAETRMGLLRTQQVYVEADLFGGGLIDSIDADDAVWTFTDPRLTSAASADFRAGIAVGFGVQASETLTLSSIGLSATIEPYAQLEVDTTATPWMSMSGGVDVSSAATASLGGVFDFEAPLDGFSLDELLLDNDDVTQAAATGHDGHWASAIDLFSHDTQDNLITAFDLGDDGATWLMGSDNSGEAVVTTLDAQGDMQWSLHLPDSRGYHALATLPDGSAIIATDACAFLARVDNLGNVLWQRELTATVLHDDCALVPWENATGAEGVAVIGTTTSERAAVGFVHLDGTLGTWNTYDAGENATLFGGTVTADGDLVVVGWTDRPSYMPASNLYAAPGGGGLILRISPDGTPNWALSISADRLTAVAEGPDGRLLVTGEGDTDGGKPRHATLLAAVSAVGDLLWSTTYAEDVVFEGLTDNGALDRPGDSYYDEPASLAFLDDGTAVLAGTTGRYDEAAVWLLRVTDDGEPIWFWMHDGDDEDRVQGMDLDTEGITWAGDSASISNADGDDTSGWVARSPLDGGLHFGTTDGWTTRSLQVDINDTTDLAGSWGWWLPGGEPMTFTASNLTMAASVGDESVNPGTASASDLTW